MNLVRSVISVFVITLAVLSVAGWIWAGGQPLAKMVGARVALALCGLSSVGSLWVLWNEKPVQKSVPNSAHESPSLESPALDAREEVRANQQDDQQDIQRSPNLSSQGQSHG